jgi:IS5 family transposase
MKARIGLDATTGLVNTAVGTAGNVSDVTQAHALLRGDESVALATREIKAWKNVPRLRQTFHLARGHETFATKGSAQQ